MFLQEECEEKLAVAMPALNAAIAALNTLKQNDISIVKAMANPPSGVKLVMESVCIMKVSCQDVTTPLSRVEVFATLSLFI